jgi:hypothetical protein
VATKSRTLFPSQHTSQVFKYHTFWSTWCPTPWLTHLFFFSTLCCPPCCSGVLFRSWLYVCLIDQAHRGHWKVVSLLFFYPRTISVVAWCPSVPAAVHSHRNNHCHCIHWHDTGLLLYHIIYGVRWYGSFARLVFKKRSSWIKYSATRSVLNTAFRYFYLILRLEEFQSFGSMECYSYM